MCLRLYHNNLKLFGAKDLETEGSAILFGTGCQSSGKVLSANLSAFEQGISPLSSSNHTTDRVVLTANFTDKTKG